MGGGRKGGQGEEAEGVRVRGSELGRERDKERNKERKKQKERADVFVGCFTDKDAVLF